MGSSPSKKARKPSSSVPEAKLCSATTQDSAMKPSVSSSAPSSKQRQKSSVKSTSHRSLNNDFGQREERITLDDNNHRQTSSENLQAQVSNDTGKQTRLTLSDNTFKPVMSLPECTLPTLPVNFPYKSAKSNSKWPIRNYAALNVNVNAKEGGLASLVLISDVYGGQGTDTTAEIFLHRSGYDGNYHSWLSLARKHGGHFSCSTSFVTGEDGQLIADCLFGCNHIALLSNDPHHGTLDHGLYVEGDAGPISLHFNVNGSHSGEHGAGCSILLCSGSGGGIDGVRFVHAVYMIRSGFKDDVVESALLCGDNEWKFSARKGILNVEGPKKNKYALYHNRDLPDSGSGSAKVWHATALDGSKPTVLAEDDMENCLCLVLCSNSSGNEDQTVATLYIISITDDGLKVSKMYGVTGKGQNTADLWKFSLINNKLTATGPSGPCRFAILSNMKNTGQARGKSTSCCLATGLDEPIRGAVSIDEKCVVGWVEQQYDIIVKINETPAAKIEASCLEKIADKYAFHRSWPNSEKKAGLYLIRVYFVYIDADGRNIMLELEGSPKQIIYQPPGVVYALNCGSSAYHALNDVVYTSEHHQFVNFSYDYCFGTRSKAKGGVKTNSDEPKIHTNTYDGFLYMTSRVTEVEAEEEHEIIYKVPNLPNDKMNLRLHSVKATPPGSIIVCDVDITDKVAKLMKKCKRHPGVSAYWIDVPITVTNNTLTLNITEHMLSAFAVFDKSYKEKQPTEEELERERAKKQKLIDVVEPLDRQLTKKEIKILGWSPNLLLNASGEAGDMSHWDTSGDWQVAEGGHGTEKVFVSSYMKCAKSQTVDLTKHFSREYLDTAPEIQVSEWYREGCGGGGYYSLEAHLISTDGEIIDSYESGMIGNIYRNGEWDEAKHTFRNYGQGVAEVTITSFGRDDKYWAGFYGPRMSTAVIRVKSEVKPQDDDRYEDIIPDMNVLSDQSSHTRMIEELITGVLNESHHFLQELLKEESLHKTVTDIKKQLHTSCGKKKQLLRRKKREMRVFVSSTFKDFKEERELLVKKTFREIHSMCTERGVFFTYVDLRWGITEEQTNHGQTIALCLREIERCRPYFICMMGERLGWSQQEDKPDELLNQSFDYAIQTYPKQLQWIEKYRYGTSVTQMEVLHGVLNDIPTNKDRSFFYLRQKYMPSGLSEDKLKAYLPESEWHHEKQQAFRKLIQQSELNVRSYTAPKEVGDLIKKDLQFCVDQDFPRGTELSPLEKEREAHVSFAEARRRIYIGREEYFKQINQYMNEKTNKPLVILGESGAGKSALVANWIGHLEESETEAFIFIHFIGSSAKSVSYIKLLRRLFEEMKEFFHLDQPVPNSDSDLIRDLPMWLRITASQAKCYIILDALNQLDDGSGTEGVEHDLQWLPRTLPHNIKMLLSTLPGRTLEAIKAANWPVMSIEPLKEEEKLKILEGYLEVIYGKTLSTEQKTMIASAKQTNNPLYLKALLDEVRMYGDFRKLTATIQSYLEAQTPGDLFAKILERLEQDFERGLNARPGLVRETTTAIWCSNRGMSEAELLDLLKVPNAVWSPFYLSLVESLVNRDGIVNFFHDHLRQAVEKKYLQTREEKIRAYLWLADFFDERELDDRKIDELPTLLSKAQALDRLREFISHLEVFRRLTQTEEGKFDLIKFWKQLGDFGEVETRYMNALDAVPLSERNTASYRQTQQALADFLIELGLFRSAKSLLKSMLAQFEDDHKELDSTVLYWPTDHTRQYKCTHPTVIQLLIRLGTVCCKQNDLAEALEYYKDATHRIDRVQTPNKKLQLTEALLGWADVLLAEGNMHEASKYLIRAREISTDVLGPKHHYVAAIINNMGRLSYKQGRIDEALEYFIQDLVLTRSEVGLFHPRIAQILNEIALVYDDKNDLRAGKLLEAALIILLDTYGYDHIEVALIRYNLGTFYFANHLFARARYQFEKAAEVFTAFLGSDHPNTQETRSALTDVMAFLCNERNGSREFRNQAQQ